MAFFPSMPDADMKHTLAREPAIGIPFSQLNEAVMRGDAPFSAGERELLAAYVSALNGCDYCQCEHAALATAFGVPAGLLAQLLQDVETAEVSEPFRAGSCTSSLRLIQLPEKQVASLRFTDRGRGTRDGTRPAVPHTLAVWHPGALYEPDLGLATAPRRHQPCHHAGDAASTRAQAISRSHP